MDRSDSLDLVLFSFVIYNIKFARITPQMLLQIDDGSQCANVSFFLSSGALQTLIPREHEEAKGEVPPVFFFSFPLGLLFPVHTTNWVELIGSFSLTRVNPATTN
jgi:hypothetical protein